MNADQWYERLSRLSDAQMGELVLFLGLVFDAGQEGVHGVLHGDGEICEAMCECADTHLCVGIGITIEDTDELPALHPKRLR